MYDEDGFDVGEDVMGEDDFSVIGIARGRGRGRGRKQAIRRVIPVPGGGVVAVQRPGWRNGQVAPGVQAPAQGLVPITFQPQEAQQFSATVSFLTFTAKTQVPFRGERLLVEVLREGVSATGRLIGQMFMGIGLQQANIQGFDIETVGRSDAFGVRMAMQPIEPGVDGNILVRLSTPLAGADVIRVGITVMGKNIM